MSDTFVCPAAKTVLSFGIYKGNTLQFVLENHPAYLTFIVNNAHPELQKLAQEVLRAGQKYTNLAYQSKITSVTEREKQLMLELYDKREHIASMFQATLLSVLRIGSLVYSKKINKTIIVSGISIPEYYSGRYETVEISEYQPYYSILIDGEEVSYNARLGKWELGNTITEVNLTCSIETGSSNDFYVLEEYPRYIERITESKVDAPTATSSNGKQYKKGHLIDTYTNSIIATFSHTILEIGAPCFHGYRVEKTFAYKSATTGKVLDKWDLKFGYPPVDFIEIT